MSAMVPYLLRAAETEAADRCVPRRARRWWTPSSPTLPVPIGSECSHCEATCSNVLGDPMAVSAYRERSMPQLRHLIRRLPSAWLGAP